jgi:hypothetical protein
MPRRNNEVRLLEDDVTTYIMVNPRNLIVQDYLRDMVWDLHARNGTKVDGCSVCEDEAHCRKCSFITICGHMICVSCLYKLKKLECPVCRFPSH